MTPSSIDLARVVGWKLSFPIASGYRSLILGKSGVFPTTYASTNPQANQVFMTSNDNPNLAVEPELSTIYLSQIHQTQRNFPGKQWIIQCLVTSCKTQRDTFWPWQLDTPKHLLNLLEYIYSILSLTAFKRVNCCWVSWFHTALYLVQPDCRDVRRLFALRPTELLLFPRPRLSFQENVLHGFFYWINGNIRLQTSLEKRSDYWTIQISQALPNFAIFAMAFQWTPVSPRDL